MSRPGRLIVVTGTGTEVGKTWVAGRLVRALRARGLTVVARKPAQSFEAAASSTDAGELALASGEDEETVCPPRHSYPVPMAPPMAAAALGRPAPALGELVSQLERSWPSPAADLAVIEGAGGVASPLAHDGDTADLARRVAADAVVLVAEPELGVINSVRLCLAALAPIPTVVYLNRFDPILRLHVLNRDWLIHQAAAAVVTEIGKLADRVV